LISTPDSREVVKDRLVVLRVNDGQEILVAELADLQNN